MKLSTLLLAWSLALNTSDTLSTPTPPSGTPDISASTTNRVMCTFALNESQIKTVPPHHAKVKDVWVLKSLWKEIATSLKERHHSVPHSRQCNGGKDLDIEFMFEEPVTIQWKEVRWFSVHVFRWKENNIDGIMVNLRPKNEPILNVSPPKETGLYININFLTGTFFAAGHVWTWLESYRYVDDLEPILKRILKALGHSDKK